MKTLTEKYQALKEGNFSKKQFLRDARLAHPNFITQFNGFSDAIRILKAKGLVHEVSEEYEMFDSEEELSAFLDKQVEKDKAEKRDTEDVYGELEQYAPTGKATVSSLLGTLRSLEDSKIKDLLIQFNDKVDYGPVWNVFEKWDLRDWYEFHAFVDDSNIEDRIRKHGDPHDLSENVEKDILDTISLNQVKKGIRYELEQIGVKSVKVSAEDWNKAKDKVRKNIEKDQNYYVHKLADVKPVKHDKRPDTMKEVPSVKNKDAQNKKNQKKVKDQHNQMEKVKINEFKKIIKKVILESLEEQEGSMDTGPGFKQGHRALVNMLERITNVAEKVGQAGEQERDALADDPDAGTYAREIEEYLRKIYNAYLYADREAGRDDEIFKESKKAKKEGSSRFSQLYDVMPSEFEKELVEFIKRLTEGDIQASGVTILGFFHELIEDILLEYKLISENISDEAYDRMEGLSNIQAQQAVKKGSGIILRELTEEGFDEIDVLEFLQILIKTNYGIVTETRKVNEQDLTPIQALQQTPHFERALRSEQDFANFIKRVEGDLWNYMASHFDTRAGSAPDEY